MSTSPGPLGCIGLIVFLVIEIAAGFTAGGLCYPLIAPLTTAIVPASEREFGEVVAVILCFIPGGLVAFLIDRLCRRVTGHSALDQIGHLPPF